MRIDRIIEWDWPQKPVIMDYLDFGPINVVIELDTGSKGTEKMPKPEEVDFSKLKPYAGTHPRITVDDRRENFLEMREKWLKEPVDVTTHRLEKPDNLMWWVFKRPPEYGKEATTMRHIMKLIFK